MSYILEALKRADAERQHARVLRERGGHGRLLQHTEGRLTVGHEDVRDLPARARDDVGVGVAQLEAEALGDPCTDRGLASTGRTDQDDVRSRRAGTVWAQRNLRFDR